LSFGTIGIGEEVRARAAQVGLKQIRCDSISQLLKGLEVRDLWVGNNFGEDERRHLEIDPVTKTIE